MTMSREEYLRDYHDERDARRRTRCHCGDDMPGFCPGPENCPMSNDEMENDDEHS